MMSSENMSATALNIPRMAIPSPRNGATAAPVNNILGPSLLHPVSRATSFTASSEGRSGDRETSSPFLSHKDCGLSLDGPKKISDASLTLAKARSRGAQRMNDAMVYLDGPQVYTCAQCRTHLTSHDDIISKSFHGRHGRAYLFDQCVNVTIGPAEDRVLITGLHSVCDIFCKRCKGMVGWTYAKAYESSQKYKEGKFIIEKINLHMEESDFYKVRHPAGERSDRWRLRSMSWGSSRSVPNDFVYEYMTKSPPASPADDRVTRSCPSIQYSGLLLSGPSPPEL